MIDFWHLASEFKQGDIVQQLIHSSFALSPYVGRVTAVHRGLGMVDVQWPQANTRMSADEIVKVNPKLTQWLPPEFDQSYSSYDTQKARAKWASPDRWAGSSLPAGFYTEVARYWSKGGSEMTAYDAVWHRFASSGASDQSMRDEIQKFYMVANRLSDLRISQHVMKTATYWTAQNRQYRVSAGEITAKRPNCPKCATQMRRTTYKMDKGARVRLFACPKDLFLVRSSDLLGPQGEALGW